MHRIDQALAAPHVIPLASHENDDVRRAVAVALGGVDTPEAVEVLLVLMTDRAVAVRDWATFGLGQQCEADSVEIRDAFAARLADDDADVRFEAIVGLARRRDNRSLGYLKAMMHHDPDQFFLREAVLTFLGLDVGDSVSDHELLGALQRRQRWLRP